MIRIEAQFHQGMTTEEYRQQMTQNRERFEENERTVSLATEDIQFFAELPNALHVLVLTEDWCEAAIANVPVLVRLARESSKLDLRFFLRDQNQELMSRFLREGVHATIPAFIFFDPSFLEIGRWYEMPTKIRAMGVAFRQELISTDPDFADIAPNTPVKQLPDTVRRKLLQAFEEFRLQTREIADQEVVREIRDIIQQGVAPGITPVRQQQDSNST